MPLDLTIDWSTPADRDAILAFITAMGFTPRDAATWDGLSMRAIVARRGETIVGVLPIEPRPVCVGDGRVVQAAHQTCVALVTDERGRGVGSLMQARLDDLLPSDVELVSVYREDPASRAYAWYARNGFRPATHVIAWERLVDAAAASVVNVEADVASLWRAARQGRPYLLDQSQRPLNEWLAVHPYRTRYAFEIVRPTPRAYAVVGIGRLHSDQARLDVLDFVAGDADADMLLEACISRAGMRAASPIRIALAEHDPLVDIVTRCGFTPGWSFDYLVKPRGGRAVVANASESRYASIDFA